MMRGKARGLHAVSLCFCFFEATHVLLTVSRDYDTDHDDHDDHDSEGGAEYDVGDE